MPPISAPRKIINSINGIGLIEQGLNQYPLGHPYDLYRVFCSQYLTALGNIFSDEGDESFPEETQIDNVLTSGIMDDAPKTVVRNLLVIYQIKINDQNLEPVSFSAFTDLFLQNSFTRDSIRAVVPPEYQARFDKIIQGLFEKYCGGRKGGDGRGFFDYVLKLPVQQDPEDRASFFSKFEPEDKDSLEKFFGFLRFYGRLKQPVTASKRQQYLLSKGAPDWFEKTIDELIKDALAGGGKKKGGYRRQFFHHFLHLTKEQRDSLFSEMPESKKVGLNAFAKDEFGSIDQEISKHSKDTGLAERFFGVLSATDALDEPFFAKYKGAPPEPSAFKQYALKAFKNLVQHKIRKTNGQYTTADAFALLTRFAQSALFKENQPVIDELFHTVFEVAMRPQRRQTINQEATKNAARAYLQAAFTYPESFNVALVQKLFLIPDVVTPDLWEDMQVPIPQEPVIISLNIKGKILDKLLKVCEKLPISNDNDSERMLDRLTAIKQIGCLLITPVRQLSRGAQSQLTPDEKKGVEKVQHVFGSLLVRLTQQNAAVMRQYLKTMKHAPKLKYSADRVLRKELACVLSTALERYPSVMATEKLLLAADHLRKASDAHSLAIAVGLVYQAVENNPLKKSPAHLAGEATQVNSLPQAAETETEANPPPQAAQANVTVPAVQDLSPLQQRINLWKEPRAISWRESSWGRRFFRLFRCEQLAEQKGWIDPVVCLNDDQKKVLNLVSNNRPGADPAEINDLATLSADAIHSLIQCMSDEKALAFVNLHTGHFDRAGSYLALLESLENARRPEKKNILIDRLLSFGKEALLDSITSAPLFYSRLFPLLDAARRENLRFRFRPPQGPQMQSDAASADRQSGTPDSGTSADASSCASFDRNSRSSQGSSVEVKCRQRSSSVSNVACASSFFANTKRLRAGSLPSQNVSGAGAPPRLPPP